MTGTGRSLWADTIPDGELARPAPTLSTDADVLIIGAGLTGLWTAWHLIERDPGLRILILEREQVGFGASGRNGGWCSALLPMSLDAIAKRAGGATATRFQRAMHRNIDEIADFATRHADPAIVHRGGTVDIARSPRQEAKFRHEVETYRRFGFGDDDYRWIDAGETQAICNATAVTGAMFTPHCATTHPLRLTHAVARAVLAAGVEIREGVDVTSIQPGRVDTNQGPFTGEVVVRATEGYTPQLDGHRREVLPLYSMMIATEPLDADTWAEIGLADRPTFADGRHMIIYGQRTTDDRFAFGGRGAPYHFGSTVEPGHDTDERIRTLLTETLTTLFPVTARAQITHHWGGVMAAPRDWHCSVRFDRASGLASAGGYVGDGLSTTHLAGRTLAALITNSDRDDDRDLISLPWVGHRSRAWEPEPLRWLGVNLGVVSARLADRADARGGSGRLWSGVLDTLLRR